MTTVQQMRLLRFMAVEWWVNRGLITIDKARDLFTTVPAVPGDSSTIFDDTELINKTTEEVMRAITSPLPPNTIQRSQ